MTREEAIKELELIAEVTVWKERREAVEMAIEALKQKPYKVAMGAEMSILQAVLER